MKLSTTVTAVVGAAAGLAVAIGAYQASSAVGEPVAEKSTTSVGVQEPVTPPVAENVLADCASPAYLVDGVCVTDVERTVVVYDDPRSQDVYDDDVYDDDVYDDDDDDDDDDRHEDDEQDEDDDYEDD